MQKQLLLFLLIVLHSCSNDHEEQTKTIPQKKENIVKVELSEQEKASAYRIDTLFSRLFAENSFVGNVLVSIKGKVIYQKSFGKAIANQSQLLNDSSLFQLASLTKSLTATCILKLVEQKKVDLDKSFSYYFTEFPYKDISIRHLLTHRSGLSNYIYFLNDSIAATNHINNEFVLNYIIQKQPPNYLKPDLRMNYCNTNYALLASLIEKVSGKDYCNFVKETIFKPCGMKTACFSTEIENVTGKFRTKGHLFRFEPMENSPYDTVMGDKGIYCSSIELYHFMEAFFNNKLVVDSLKNLAIMPASKERKLVNYGFGWRMIHFNDSNKIVFHNGWWRGYRNAMQRRMKDSINIIILSNRLNASVYQTWRVFDAIDGIKHKPLLNKEEEEF